MFRSWPRDETSSSTRHHLQREKCFFEEHAASYGCTRIKVNGKSVPSTRRSEQQRHREQECQRIPCWSITDFVGDEESRRNRRVSQSETGLTVLLHTFSKTDVGRILSVTFERFDWFTSALVGIECGVVDREKLKKNPNKSLEDLRCSDQEKRHVETRAKSFQ